MTILEGYSKCRKEVIESMTEREAKDALIRIFSLEANQFAPTDSWHGCFLIPDDIADAFAGYTSEYTEKSFVDELEELINKHNKEIDSSTPDFILARHIEGMLSLFSATVKARDSYFYHKGFNITEKLKNG